MEIKSTLIHQGQVIPFVYRDIDSPDELKGKRIKGVHAYCFCGEKLVIVYAKNKGSWGPPGGAVEFGETVEGAVAREVFEETNMRILKQKVFGYLDALEPGEKSERTMQTRSVCIVEPIGEFMSDPDGDVTEIKLIDPKDIKNYFDWGEDGSHYLKRVLQLKETL